MESDEELAEIGEAYGSGKMLTGEIKAKLVDECQKFVADYAAKRALVTDADVELFMSQRPIHPYPDKWGFEDKSDSEAFIASFKGGKEPAPAKEESKP